MYKIGLDVGGTKIAIGIVNSNFDICYKDNIPTNREFTCSDITDEIIRFIKNSIQKFGILESDINFIGIGWPGVVNTQHGKVVFGCNLRFKDYSLKDEIQRHFNLPVLIENDANCAALAESTIGAGANYDDSVTITIGTGIGGGIIVNRKVYSGSNFAAAEMGHMVIVVDGEECTCGRRGCWEAYASATALIKQTKECARANSTSIINEITGNDFSKINAKTAFEACELKDRFAKEVVGNYLKYLSVGVTNIINILQPDVFVIGGGVSKEGDNLLKPVKEFVDKEVYNREDSAKTKVVLAKLGNDAGILGATMLIPN